MESSINIDVVQTLASAGLKLLVINNRVYMTEWFESATATMYKHKIKGRDVTRHVMESSQFVSGHIDQLAVSAFMTKVMSQPSFTIEFHTSIPFVYYS